jgi:drug/metabolite transporter (DMT)-like permease
MLGAVALQVVGAVVMKLLADASDDAGIGVVAVGLASVAAINIARLGIWGVAHRRYPLSSTFPLSSLFFPAMLLVALAFGDEVGAGQTIGALLISAGVFWLTRETGGP